MVNATATCILYSNLHYFAFMYCSYLCTIVVPHILIFEKAITQRTLNI